MKGFLIATVLGFGLLGASVLTAGSAQASEKYNHRTYGGYPVYEYFGVLLYGAPNRHYRPEYERDREDYRPSHRHARRHNHHERYVSTPRQEYRQGRMDYQAIRPCHPTSKIGYVDYGRRARIGGTMCYDAYGKPYIVQGSRYIIQYY